MDRRVFEVFQQRCLKYNVGGRVLEVGAVPDDTTLLNLPALEGRAEEKIGINMDAASQYNDFTIVQGNANDMFQFEDASFDTVLSNATFEHDKYFWKSIAEIHRVTKPGGIVIIGTPGYGYSLMSRPLNEVPASREKGVGSWFLSARKRIPALYLFTTAYTASFTLGIHNYPGDYYRFSPQTYAEVFFDGFEDVDIQSHFKPPVIVGSGIKSR